ncbi:MAG: RluA family pseudouridine synthase [Rhodospirillaceae bacterium]|nr:RluA family pseudouridine synthase [Rhodospirillaceae bacterium]MBT6829298.1 RluA family pseudouridine synthase [Rhodospirillaceae bacterium]MBT7294060.1 RluA family pseudouridine synthase [Rhodospirillaceae bacterium]
MLKSIMPNEGETQYSLSAGDERARLDKFLALALPDLSRNRLKGLIESGQVRVGGETITEPAYRVKPGAEVVLTVPEASEDAAPAAQAMALDVRYEDDDLIVINKAAGLVVHPAAGNFEGTLVNGLVAHCGKSLSGIGGVRRPGIVHRLDKDTSGLLVAAKNDAAHTGLSKQFEAHSLDRAYLALVWGSPLPPQGEIEGNIGRSPRNRKKMAILKRGGRAARTHYRVIEHLADGCWSLVECRLETGRTHQIRVHLSSRGYTVVGDPVYGGTRRGSAKALPQKAAKAVENWHRQALHAYRLGFKHPRSGAPIELESEPPEDMLALLAAGREY